MKKTLLLITAIILIFTGCKKFDLIEASKVEIINETIERGSDYVKINAEYEYPVELESITLYLSEKEDMSIAKTYECNVDGKTFSVEAYDLKDRTKYYYQFEFDNGYGKIRNDKSELPTTHIGYEYVDLGLPSGLKWATCNVGASSPEEYGNYYAWGETTTKDNYLSSNSLTYGNVMSDISGDAQYDAATTNWGGNWRMPTYDEMNELRNNCTWEWIAPNGVNGYKVTSKTNGNSIFLPAAGYRYGSSLGNAGSYGYYWSSTPYGSDSVNACSLDFYSSDHSMGSYYRYYGRSVRPVTE